MWCFCYQPQAPTSRLTWTSIHLVQLFPWLWNWTISISCHWQILKLYTNLFCWTALMHSVDARFLLWTKAAGIVHCPHFPACPFSVACTLWHAELEQNRLYPLSNVIVGCRKALSCCYTSKSCAVWFVYCCRRPDYALFPLLSLVLCSVFFLLETTTVLTKHFDISVVQQFLYLAAVVLMRWVCSR